MTRLFKTRVGRPAGRPRSPSRYVRTVHALAPSSVETLEGRTLLAFSPVGPETLVNTYVAANQTVPDVAADADGDYVVVWESEGQDGGSTGVYGQRYNAGGIRQGAEFRVNTTLPGRQSFPKVAMDADGDFVVTWMSDHEGKGIYARRFNGAGQPQGAEFRVNTNAAGDPYAPDVAVDAAGNFVIAWDTIGADIYIQRYSAAGSPLGSETRVNTSPGTNLLGPTMAANAGGDFVVGWYTFRSGEAGRAGSVFLQKFDATGARVGGEIAVDNGVDTRTYDVAIGMDNAGGIVAAWDALSSSNTSHDLLARRYDPSGAPGDFVVLQTAPSATPLDLAVAGPGEFVATFCRSENLTDVVARWFDASNGTVGREIRANTRVQGMQTAGAVALSQDGKSVVVWASEGQDGSGNGIASQRYAPVAVPGSLNGFAWNDLNQNRLQDPGEPGIEGVAVDLYTSLNVHAGSMLTAGNGRYRFTNLRGGDGYYVTFTPKANNVFVAANIGSNDAIDSDVGANGRSSTFTAASGQTATAIDAGIIPPAIVEGRVWDDANANGIQDAGESGRSGVAVTLFVGNQSRGTAVTSGDGAYRLTATPSAYYEIAFNVTPGTVFTARDQGVNDSIDSDVDPATGRLIIASPVPGQTYDVDAGVGPAPRVSGVVYRDTNRSGWQDPADAALLDTNVFADANLNGLLDPGEAWTRANDTGAFVLTVAPGTHRITAVVPAGWTEFTPPRTVALGAGESANGIEIAYVPSATERHATPEGPEFRVNSATAGTQGQSSVARTPDGGFVVVWFGMSPPGDTNNMGHVYGRVFGPNGVPRGVDFQVSVDAVPFDARPAVAVAPDGTIVVAWQGVNSILARRFNAAASPLSSPVIINQNGGPKFSPRVAVDPAGGFAVAWWGEVNTDAQGVAARFYDGAGTPRGNQFQVNEVVAGTQYLTGLAFDAAGRLVVGYSSIGQDGSGDGAFARRFVRDGSQLWLSFGINTTTSGSQLAGPVAVNGDGVELYTWSYGHDVFGQLYDADGSRRGGEFRINAYSRSFKTALTVTALSDGYFVVAWQGNDQARPAADTYAQLVSPEGVPHGREFRLNTSAAASQSAPSLTALSAGRFVASWIGVEADGVSTDVFAQRFATTSNVTSFGGRVWDDSDGDGVQDAAEAGLNGVAVELYTEEGSIADTTVTAAGGRYVFAGAQAGRNYTIRFVAPAGRMLSPRDQGGDEQRDSDADPSTGRTALFLGQANVILDAGTVRESTISGIAYHDLDGDGVRDAGEPPLSEWVVYLDTDRNGQFGGGERSATTTADGTYSFGGLRAGEYRVALAPYTYWAQSTPASAVTRTVAIGQALTDVHVGAAPSVPTDMRAAPVGPETRVNTATAGNQSDAAVASDAAGNYVVAWSDGLQGKLQRYNAAGVPLGGEVALSLGGGALSVAMARDGRFVVTATGGGGVLAQRFNAAGTPVGTAFPVDVNHGAHAPVADVAIEDDGDFVVVWQSTQDGSGYAVTARRFSADGAPVGGEFVVNGNTAGDQTRPRVAMDADGDFAVTFLSRVGGGDQYVWARRFNAAGDALGGDFRVNPPPFGTLYEFPDVAMNAAGEFVIVYGGFDVGGGGRTIEARRYDAQGRPQGLPFIASDSTVGWDEYPAVAMRDDGTFTVTWRNDGNTYDIYGQLFSAAGTDLGRQFFVNTTTAGIQTGTAVAMQPSGFVAAWTSRDQDGDGDGVFAQRFETFRHAASVGGVAFVDANDNGVRDAGEAAREGVVVRLVDDFGRRIGQRSTGSDGRYRFDDLRPGTACRLEFLTPSGFAIAHRDRGGDDAIDSDVDPVTGNTAAFTLAPDQVDLGWGVGFVTVASVTGVKFLDADADGVRDANEEGLEGWIVFLDEDWDGLLDAGERSAVTGPSGGFAFPSLRPGAFRLAEVPQLRWQLTAPPGVLDFTLVPGQTRQADLGNLPTAPVTSAVPVGPELAARVGPAIVSGRRDFRIAADANGNFVVVEHYSGPEGNGYARLFDRNGVPRGELFRVTQHPAYSQYEFSVAMDADGDFVVAWRSDQQDDAMGNVYARRFDAAGQPLGDEFRVNSTLAGLQTGPSVATDADGNFIVAWEEVAVSRGDRAGVFARRYDRFGVAEGGEFRVNTTNIVGTLWGSDRSMERMLPAVAMDADGDFVVTWQGAPVGSSASNLYFQQFDRAGNPLGNEVLYDTDSTNPAVAMNAAGEFVLAWGAPGFQSGRLLARRYDPSGRPQGNDFVVSDMAPHGTLMAAPVVRMDAGGGVLVAWRPNTAGENNALYRRYTGSGIPVGDATPLNAPSGPPAIAMLPDGSFLSGRFAGTPLIQRYETYGGRAAVGGVVWHDTNGNGVREAGEPAGSGVAVELLSPSGAVAARTVTGPDGAYRFDARPNTQYAVRYVLPAGKVPTLNDQGGNDSVDSDADPFTGLTAVISPARAEADLTLGLGLVSPGSINGLKFNDRNGNGTREADEEGLGGWTVYIDVDRDGLLNAGEPSSVTTASGSFNLPNLPPGEHFVREVAQDLWSLTTPLPLLTKTLLGGQNVVGVLIGGHTTVPDSLHSAAWPEVVVDETSYPGMGVIEVASDAAGNFVAVWPTFDTGNGPEMVRGRRFSSSGVALGGDFTVNAVPIVGRSYPKIAADADGDFVVVWQQQVAPNDWDIFARRYDGGANPSGPEFRVNTTTAGGQFEPDVASSRDGSFIVTWRASGPGTEGRVYYQRFDAAGAPVSDEAWILSLGVQAPAVSMDASGGFVLAWTGWRPERLFDAEVFARRFNAAGEAVGSLILVNAVTQRDQVEADVAAGPDGDFVVAWNSRAGGETMRARRFSASGIPQGDELLLGTGSTPRTAKGGDGSFVVTWQASTGGAGDDVQAVRFNAAGLRQGARFTPQNAGGFRSRPSPAMDDAGNFVIAWSTSSSTGSQHMAAQRFVIDRAPTTTGLPDVAVTVGTPESSVDLFGPFADDRDADNQLTYAVTGNTNPALVTSTTVDREAGTLTVAYASGLTGEAVLTVRASDRNGLYAEAALRVRVGPAQGAAQVTDVFLNGSAWPAAFRQALEGAGLGEVAYGFRVPTGDSLNELPWAGIDRISMRFNRDVTLEQAALAIQGVNRNYEVSGFTYNSATRTGTWTLRTALVTDSVALAVPGAASGMTAAGGASVRVNVLPGDVNRDGRVNAMDMAQVRAKMQTSTANPGAGSRRYSVFHDVSGDGRINERDVLIVRANQGKRVPAVPQAAFAPATVAATSAGRPATRPTVRQDMFSATPILIGAQL